MTYTGTAARVLDALRPFDLRDEGNGKYRANSPLRPGSNSHAFSVVIHDDEHGAYDDKVGGDSGSLYDLARKLNIELPERGAAQQTKRAYAGIDDYAKSHGLEADDLRAAGWREVIDGGRKALAFDTATGTRLRYLDGEQPAYKSPYGFSASWYGMKRGLPMAQDKGALVLVNGEVSAVAAQKQGIPAITLAGGGERPIPDALLADLRAKWQGDVWIALDCDDAGRKAAQRIAAQLPNAKILDLQLTDKGDMADLCALYGDGAWARVKALADTPVKVSELPTVQGAGADAIANALRELAQAKRAQRPIDDLLDDAERQLKALRQERPKAITISIRDVVAQNEAALKAARKSPNAIRGLKCGIPDIDRAVGGFVDARLHVLYAATSMGKTTLSAQFASSWMIQGRGLIAPTESNPLAFANKMAAALSGVSTDKMDSGYLTDADEYEVIDAYDIMDVHGVDFMGAGKTTPGMIREELQRAVEAGKPYRWLIVDSMSKLSVPGAQGIYDVTSAAVDELQNIALETGVMVFATCQIGRSAKNRVLKAPQLNDAKGSGDVEEDADVVMSLYRHDYYVRRGEAQPNDLFPPDTAMIQFLKHRWKDIGDGATMITLNTLAGTRFVSRAENMVQFREAA